VSPAVVDNVPVTDTVPSAVWAEPANVPAIVDTVPVSDLVPAAVWAEGAPVPTIEYLTEQYTDIPGAVWADRAVVPSVVDNEPIYEPMAVAVWAESGRVPAVVDNEPVFDLVPAQVSAEAVSSPASVVSAPIPSAAWADAGAIPTEVIYLPNFYDVTATLPDMTMACEVLQITEWTLPSVEFQATILAGVQGVCRLNKWLPCTAVFGSQAAGLGLPGMTASCVFSSDQPVTGDMGLPEITATGRAGAVVSAEVPLGVLSDGELTAGRLLPVVAELPSVRMTSRLSRTQVITVQTDVPVFGMEAETGGYMSAELPGVSVTAAIPVNNYTVVDGVLPGVVCHARVSFGNRLQVSAMVSGGVQVSSRLVSHQDDISVVAEVSAPVMTSRVSMSYSGVLRYFSGREDADAKLIPAGYDETTGVMEYSR